MQRPQDWNPARLISASSRTAGNALPCGRCFTCLALRDLEAAFEEPDDRDAARNFMDLLAASEGQGRGG
jgi:hypothetical protein